MLDVDLQQRLWAPTVCYLDAATYGLPASPTTSAVQTFLDDWRNGTGDWLQWTGATEPAREAWARLVGFPTDAVAVGSNVSTLMGMLPPVLPDGAQVLVPTAEFTSATFPWMADPRLEVREVDPMGLADAVTSRTAAVCFSIVRSNDGRVLDGAAIKDACDAVGALSIVDVTQATGWLPLHECRFDAVVGGAYKWLSAPRGTAFLAVTDELRARVRPTGAGWFAGEDPMQSLYGGPLRLAETARALDVSPAWLPWVGTAAALAVIEELGVDRIHEHDLELANSFRSQIGLDSDITPIVSLLVPGVEEELARLGIRTSVREGRVRLSFHCWNTQGDADLAATAVRRARDAA